MCQLNLNKKVGRKKLDESTKRLYQCNKITAHPNNGGPFTAGVGQQVTVPRRMDVLLQALTRQLHFQDGVKATTIFALPAGNRIVDVTPKCNTVLESAQP